MTFSTPTHCWQTVCSVTCISYGLFCIKIVIYICAYRPIGQTLKPLIDSLSEGARGVAFGQSVNHNLRDYEPQASRRAESPDFVELNTAIDEVRLAKVHVAWY
jgi:hypothetical protein